MKFITMKNIDMKRSFNKQHRMGKLFFAQCLLPGVTGRFLIVCYFLLITSHTHAQTSITLQQAIDTALINNLTVKNEKLRTEYQQQLIASSSNIPVTNISAQYGQFNSYYNDLNVGISQTLNFPAVYARQKELLTEEWRSTVLNLKIKESELKKYVTEVYFNLLYIQQKKKLLQENDSLFAEFLSKSLLRFQKGESNLLEKTTAENQRGQIALQLSQLEQDWEIVQLQFQFLLNSTSHFTPSEKDLFFQGFSLLEDPNLDTHPLIQYQKQQQSVAFANTKVERSKLLPDITFGYNLMGMKGMGANDIMYNSNLRFHSIHFGLGIPIFTSSQKSKINASKINEQLAAIEYEMNLKNLELSFAQALKQFQKYQDAVVYFKKTALKNAETIKITANKQFMNGDINYLEWVLLINQSITIQNEYIEATKNRNKVAAEINFYLNK